jgi:hypothetical protein
LVPKGTRIQQDGFTTIHFSDDLLRWCDAGWDYIGAPWIPSEDVDWLDEPAVGNGGYFLDPECSEWPLERWRESENPGPWGYNNDLFWAFSARRYFPPFKVATVEDALQFSFETCPRKCLK